MGYVGNLTAALVLTASTAITPAYALRDYNMCKAEVSELMYIVREVENRRVEIGTIIKIPLKPSLSEEMQTCIARGITAETEGDYKILRNRGNEGLSFILERIRQRL